MIISIQSFSYRERFPHKPMKTREEEYTQQEEFSSADTDEIIKRILIMDITLTFKKVLQAPQIDDFMGIWKPTSLKARKKFHLK